MKITKSLLVAGLGAATIVTASAGPSTYSFASTSGGSSVSTSPGATSSFDLGVYGLVKGIVGVTGSYAITTGVSASGTGSSYFSAISGTAASFTATSGLLATSFTDTITFTTAPGTPQGDYFISFYATHLTGTGITGSTTASLLANEEIVVAPEPAQTVAGAMLLGCGGLIFAGRRMFTKKSA